MKTSIYILVLLVVGFRLLGGGHAQGDLQPKNNGIDVVEWTRREIQVAIVEDMASAGMVAGAALETNTVDSFVMGEVSNANMEFFGKLKSCTSVKRLILTNIEDNNLDLTQVVSLFGLATSIDISNGGRIDASFANLDHCAILTVDGVISPRTLATVVDMKRLEYVEFFVDDRMQFEDVAKLAQAQRLEYAGVYPVEQFRIPKEWVEKLNGNAKLREIIDPVRSGWIRDPE